MPGLFSRRSKSKAPAQLISTKGYLGAVSSADIDRLGLSSPTPSTADAHLLPHVHTKDDLPPPPPKEAASSSGHQPQHRDTPSSSQSSHLRHSPLPRDANDINEFGQLHAQRALKSATVGASSHSADRSYLQPASASTFAGGRRLTPTGTLRSVSSRSHFANVHPMSASAVDVSSSFNSLAYKTTYAYGYTPEGWHVHLEAARVLSLLEACGEQIRNRGLDEPLIFSSMALDLSPSNATSMIRLFATTSSRQHLLPSAFLDETRYANPHDLAAVIKWAFARMGRVLAVPVPVAAPKKGELREEMIYVQQRGFLELETYNAWREQERRQQYPATAFADFLSLLPPENAKLLVSLFSLLSSTASYSLKNGMMPARLAKHFGSLIFGLPEDETFARTYEAYVRASNAAEHLLLAYIRFQGTTEALPPRLAQHINGYPAILATEISLPSASSKLVPVTQIERNVRLYSADLVQSACEMDLAHPCPEWQDCCDTNEVLGKDPQLSDKFRKLINLRGGAIQGRRPSSANTRDVSVDDGSDAVAAHSSLVSKQWDDFTFGGFAAPDSSKLAFDLNESLRRNRTAKRETVHWSDFSKDGFQNGQGETLADVLSFDDVLKQEVQNWPSERDQIHAKLKSRQDKLPPFNYDNAPRILASPTLAGTPQGKLDSNPVSRMDEAFADVWVDYLLGSGWSNRDELTHRNANFVVVQYKSRPNASTVGSQSAGSSLSAPTSFQVSARKDENLPKDERVDAAWFVIQEIVPAQYRADLEAFGRGTSKGRAMIRKLTMFRSRRDREKSNGNGHVNEKSMEQSADDVFRPGPGGSTKRILLADQLHRVGSKNASQGTLRSNATSVERERPASALAAPIRHEDDMRDATAVQDQVVHAASRSEGQPTGSKLISTLRAKSMRVVQSARSRASSPALKSQAAFATNPFGAQSSPRTGNPSSDPAADASFTSADYETRTIATDTSPAMGDDNVSIASSSGTPKRKPSQLKAKEGAKRQTSGRDDAWTDIMVKANGSRMAGQDVPITSTRKASLNHSRMDDTAQLSLVEPGTGASTPRMGEDMPVEAADGSVEGPRSSTPPTRTNGAPLLGLGLAGHANADVAGDHSADGSATDIPMRDASLRDATPLPTLPLAPGPAIDPVAAARAALKSRREMPERPPAQIDTKRLVESLRAGLSPIEAVRASKEAAMPASPALGFPDVALKSADKPRATSPVPPAVGTGKAHKDPFAKDPLAGRVADVASKFGGRTVVKKGDVDKPLPASPTSTRDPDEIYPEDAASNHPTPVHSTDSTLQRNDDLQGTAAGDVEQLDARQGVYRWRKNGPEGEGEEEGEVPTRFAAPYQPGMPLDNVLEESESVVSGSTNP